MDEAAYANYFSSGIAVIGRPTSVTRRYPEDDEDDAAIAYINNIISTTFKTVAVDNLSLLHMLQFDEIMNIRRKGKFLVDLIQSLTVRAELRDGDITNLCLSLSAYWKIICDELDRLHPGAARRATQVGLTIKKHSDLSPDEASRGLSFILSGVLSLFAGEPNPEMGLLRKIIDKVSFRWLFQAEGPELRALRRVLSRNAVLAAQTQV